ncbi:MAG: nickel-dependent lactate racemase [Christensenella hongkongensis]|uniref:nickel-dependent lactate racemase n=1 Tax=Christensenella hongkongensis TaxID=270498 RepID=UPI002A74BAFB|nr:nickel-dependent lactate racemase [Christensenella hongkongensis]MDY3003134.1 nickel-dependent lactate racemase [Christensenella hongkongensis]
MKVELGFAKGTQTAKVPEECIISILKPNEVTHELTGEAEVRRSVEHPIASKRLREIAKPGEKIAIITSDITRPMPSKIVLPVVLDELKAAGVSMDDVTVVFALGSHRKQTEEEMRYLAGDAVYDEVKCIDSDPKDFVHMGDTSRGTPVDIFTPVAQADRRICLGNIEFHYFAGYSGGTKAIMPGVSTRAAIQSNHSRMVEESSHAGKLAGNPVREDIDEVQDFVPIDFIVNVVLDEKKQIIKCVSGHWKDAHKAGCDFLDTLYKVVIPERADIVIVSPGGYPKDINLYQAQKALDNAKHAVKDGGIIILVASCKEGLGEGVFERWMTTAESPDFMVEEIERNFELGGHKAAAIGMVMQKSDVYLVSDLPDDFVKGIFFKPYQELQSAVNHAFSHKGLDAKVIIMPYGGSTLPFAE